MPLEIALQRQIAINDKLLGLETVPPVVYFVTDPATAAYELLGMDESEFDAFLAGVICRGGDWGEIDGD